ncbi:MmcQ/YjbR family DNA-binding protein [Robertkochia solimangrovi]|uniref:MmcQ/YjbR family DNA-binding protein n=1 Tax=Robertkochia solimangrovi TaxID=2213046 RepID=UPI00117D79D9|nr:MmcQ/YjbR family DNA-binding protein [Robertkochia solimangrovi]TRZ46307.1 MmcQ/YjbR family DNA-binding protein [Robertkochia solimangrovi]
MNIDDIRSYCIGKKGVTEEFPFDEDTLVFKVKGKMFALTPLDKWEAGEPSVNLKCNPDRNDELRDEYQGIYPGYHMNKTHWNTVEIGKDVPDHLIFDLIDQSYRLVVQKLPKRLRQQIE